MNSLATIASARKQDRINAALLSPLLYIAFGKWGAYIGFPALGVYLGDLLLITGLLQILARRIFVNQNLEKPRPSVCVLGLDN